MIITSLLPSLSLEYCRFSSVFTFLANWILSLSHALLWASAVYTYVYEALTRVIWNLYWIIARQV